MRTVTSISAITDIPCALGSGTLQVCRRGRNGNVILAAMARPDRRNALNDASYEDLIALLRLSARDPSVACIVLTGFGDFFSSGADLKAGGFEPTREGRQTLHKPAGRFMMEIISFPKILAAAVQGPAVGIAVTLLMHCDIVHCTPRTTFWAPFSRLALVPELCSSVTFLQTMGLSKANELLLLGKLISADKAMEWNICSEIVKGCDESGDPFHRASLASRLCDTIDQKLLNLPQGAATAEYFVSLVKGRRRQELEQVCRAELIKLDERFDSGHVSEAARQLKIGSSREQPQSKL